MLPTTHYKAYLGVPDQIGSFGSTLHFATLCFVGGGGLGLDIDVPVGVGFGVTLNLQSSIVDPSGGAGIGILPLQLWWVGGAAEDIYELHAANDSAGASFLKVLTFKGAAGRLDINRTLGKVKIYRVAGAGTPLISVSV